MKRMFVAIFFAAASVAAPFSFAQDKDDAADLNVMRQAARADKRAFVASALDLTPAEAKRFWPIYDEYQRELNLANQQRTLTIESAISAERVSDLYAKRIANDLIQSAELEARARRKMSNAVMRALPPRKAARYIQLETKLHAIYEYDLASTIPLVRAK